MSGAVLARLARSPTFRAWLPVAVLPPVLLAEALLTDKGPDVTAFGPVAAVVGCLPLVLRGRLGFLALGPLLTAGIVLILWQLEPGNTVVLIPMVALADLAHAQRPPPQRLGRARGRAVRGRQRAAVRRRRRRAVQRRRAQRGAVRARAGGRRHGPLAGARRSRRSRSGGWGRSGCGSPARCTTSSRTRWSRSTCRRAWRRTGSTRTPSRRARALRAIKDTSGEALSDLRATLGVLRGEDGDAPVRPAAGLGDLDELAAGLRGAGVRVELDVGDVGELPAAVHAAGYRIVQEALTNALRHAGAAHVRVRVARDGGRGPARGGRRRRRRRRERRGRRHGQRPARDARARRRARRLARGRPGRRRRLARGGDAARGRGARA